MTSKLRPALHLALVLAAGVLGGCGGVEKLAPTRGYLLISIDTLRADHLGCYGYARDTSPFLDSLAGRGALFEHAYVQLPGTLPSHMSIFTGLYPQEHGVMPPTGVLSAEIETLPEVFRRHGFRTAGHTEGGYMHGGYGFARGFEDWSHDARKIESDVERTLARGLDFLRGLGPDERFFLFLHTYVVHDPYFPPEDYLARFWPRPPPETFRATGPNLVAFNRGQKEMSDEALDYFRAAYDASIRYADDVFRGFFAELAELGLDRDLTVIVTSDHGEEFREHGRMVHEQIYPETLRVPLIVTHPDLEGPRRIATVVESVDLAPTLFELARLEPAATVSGESLVPLLTGDRDGNAGAGDGSEAFAQSFDGAGRTVIERRGETVRQLLVDGSERPVDHVWIAGSRSFDVLGGRLAFEATAFHEPRTLRVEVGGETVATASLEPEVWTPVEAPLGASKKTRVTLATETCTVPAEVGPSEDRRCLGFAVRGVPLMTLELYDLARDPTAQEDVAGRELPAVRRLLPRLDAYRRQPVSSAEERQLDPALEERLRALGYLQ